ncbi:MAG: YkgJ family cysteine cluster protein [Nitrospira sp.]|nr:YkgJ family cysteine cluster protein [Nitrospira sp.]
MPFPSQSENFTINIQTPVGPIQASVAVPSGFIPLTTIIPLMQSIGSEIQELASTAITKTREPISCQKGCAACCRMLIPMAPPEALALKTYVETWEPSRRDVLLARLQSIQDQLQKAGLDEPLKQVVFSQEQFTDEDLEPINHAYYALRIPCPFLENEACSIYDYRPSACRELLVTSPAERCQDFANQDIHPIPVPVRIGTVLSHLWSTLHQGPIRLIPLPYALLWADNSPVKEEATLSGPQLLQQALETTAQYLQHASS